MSGTVPNRSVLTPVPPDEAGTRTPRTPAPRSRTTSPRGAPTRTPTRCATATGRSSSAARTAGCSPWTSSAGAAAPTPPTGPRCAAAKGRSSTSAAGPAASSRNWPPTATARSASTSARRPSPTHCGSAARRCAVPSSTRCPARAAGAPSCSSTATSASAATRTAFCCAPRSCSPPAVCSSRRPCRRTSTSGSRSGCTTAAAHPTGPHGPDRADAGHFPWARIGTPALLRYAQPNGWHPVDQWVADGRPFVALRRDRRVRTVSQSADTANSAAVISSQFPRKTSGDSPLMRLVALRLPGDQREPHQQEQPGQEGRYADEVDQAGVRPERHAYDPVRRRVHRQQHQIVQQRRPDEPHRHGERVALQQPHPA